MTQTSGGHYLHTADGLHLISPPVGVAQEGAVQTAYRAYLDHRPGCSQCTTHPIVCDDAKALWDVYKALRAAS